MKLETVELRRIRIPLVAPFRTSFGTERDREVLLVHVVGRGRGGLGRMRGDRPGRWYSSEYTDGATTSSEPTCSPACSPPETSTAQDVAPMLRR